MFFKLSHLELSFSESDFVGLKALNLGEINEKTRCKYQGNHGKPWFFRVQLAFLCSGFCISINCQTGHPKMIMSQGGFFLPQKKFDPIPNQSLKTCLQRSEKKDKNVCFLFR